MMLRVIIAAFAPRMLVNFKDRQHDSTAELAKRYCEGPAAICAEGSAGQLGGQEQCRVVQSYVDPNDSDRQKNKYIDNWHVYLGNGREIYWGHGMGGGRYGI